MMLYAQGRAQQPDGYLNTYYTLVEPEGRWSNLVEGHELYCAGHLIEAAVAYYEATEKDELLKIACRFADLICQVFGPDEGQIKGYPGHQEIELALVKLFYCTGVKRYLSCARFFIDERGKSPNYFEAEIKKRNGNLIFPEFRDYVLIYAQRMFLFLSSTSPKDMQYGQHICILPWLISLLNIRTVRCCDSAENCGRVSLSDACT